MDAKTRKLTNVLYTILLYIVLLTLLVSVVLIYINVTKKATKDIIKIICYTERIEDNATSIVYTRNRNNKIDTLGLDHLNKHELDSMKRLSNNKPVINDEPWFFSIY